MGGAKAGCDVFPLPVFSFSIIYFFVAHINLWNANSAPTNYVICAGKQKTQKLSMIDKSSQTSWRAGKSAILLLSLCRIAIKY